MQTILPPTPPLRMRAMPKKAALFQLRKVLALLTLLVGALVCWGLQRSLHLPLPDMAWVAKYVGKGRPNFEQAQLLHNPWGVLPGCIWLAGRAHYLPTDAASDVACSTSAPALATPATANAASVSAVAPAALPTPLVLPDLDRVAQATLAWRKSGAQGQAPAMAQGQQAPQGQAVQLTVVPQVQTQAQHLARCFTGDLARCRALGVDPVHWATHYENAAARMAGVAIVDVATGAIEAMASAHSNCYEADYTSPAQRSADCPALPFAPHTSTYRLGNHALSEAMPASLDKVLLALAGLSDATVANRLQGAGRERFLKALQTSDSAYFLDMVFCRDKGFAACTRMAKVRALAEQLGWNTGCDAQAKPQRCGLFNVLYDPRKPLLGNYAVLGGRIMPAHMGNEAYLPSFAANCSAMQWEHCREGGVFIDLMSEALGQGSALATPVGMATLYANVARAANAAGAAQLPQAAPALVQAHLVAGAGQADSKPAGINIIPPQHAALVLEGLARISQAGGTAHSACLRANSQRLGGAAKACKHSWWSAKTGTPSFAHKDLSLRQRAALCAQPSLSRANAAACKMLPYKWFAAAVKTNQTGDFTKVVVVLAERNWHHTTGLVDSPYDRGSPNVAAELGIRLMQSLYFPTGQAAPTLLAAKGGAL